MHCTVQSTLRVLSVYFLLCMSTHLCLPFTLSMQIISSATPCGDFFFRCCRPSGSQRVDVASAKTLSSSKIQGSCPAVDRSSDITNMVKKCNELDLNIIIIWKVHITERWHMLSRDTSYTLYRAGRDHAL